MSFRPAPFAAAFLLALALAAGCAAHEKTADKAAAVGDWKTAEAEYAEALRKDPKRADLQQKYQQARATALYESSRKAKACWAARDFECALAESDYALRLDAGSVEMATLRADAAREAALVWVRRADDTAARGDWKGALQLLASAQEVSRDPAVASAVQYSSSRVVGGAVREADRLRAQAQFPAAIDLLTLAARVDPGVQPRLESTRLEYERWKDAEAERLAVSGDQLLAQGRYAEAEQAFRQAVAIRPRSRAEPMSRYAGAMAAGTGAAQRHDWPAAERAFSEAAQLSMDRGQASAQLERVRIRPYAFVLRSVLVRPTRPDGWPWAGGRNRELDRMVAWLSRGNLVAGQDAVEMARRLPRENQPTLVVTIALPDGRGVQTAPRRGAYALLEGGFTVTTNGFDERAISIRVVHDEGSGRPVDVGLVNARLADIVARGELSLGGGALLDLRLAAVPSDQPDGAIDRLAPIPDRDNLAGAWSQPAPGAKAWRVAGVEASLPPAAAGRGEGVSVEIVQGPNVVYRSPPAQGAVGRWTPSTVYLFARPDETLGVRLVAGPRQLVSSPVAGRALDQGSVRVAGADGSAVTLRVEPRRSGPGSGPGM